MVLHFAFLAKMRVAVPCRCRLPEKGEDLFSPGIVIEDSRGQRLGRIFLSEASRNRGFSRRLGFVYDRTQYELILEVGEMPVLRLLAKARSVNAAPRNEVVSPVGEAVGKVEMKLSAIRSPTRRDRATFRDAAGQEIGYAELVSGFTGVKCNLVDRGEGWEYRMHFEDESLIRSETATEIDARLLLAWCFYIRFYLDAADD